jgi:acetylornithine deacetylase
VVESRDSHARRVHRIARLVRHPSVSSCAPGWDQSNRAVIDELAGMLLHAGFEVEVMGLPNNPDKANLIATFGRGEGGLVLAGHTDTVPFDAARWRTDPFKATCADGKLYGLGAADMKAFLALAVEAVDGLDKDRLKAPVIVLATADEESSMDGARALVSHGRPRGRHAIIGEPTDMRPVRAHKGILFERLRVIGRTGHASDPRLGKNAIEGMHKVVGALMALRAELAVRYKNPLFEVATPTLNFGRMHGGDSPNRICGECELDLDVRVLPGMDLEALRGEVMRAAEDALAGSGFSLMAEPLTAGTPPHELAAHAELVRLAEELTGAQAGSVAFATEAPYLAQLGTDTIVLGPGGISEAHCPDEFVREDRLEPTVQLLQAAVRRLCQAPPP